MDVCMYQTDNSHGYSDAEAMAGVSDVLRYIMPALVSALLTCATNLSRVRYFPLTNRKNGPSANSLLTVS